LHFFEKEISLGRKKVQMKRIALTGGIACGKSMVARLLREKGVPVVDADQLARDVVAPGTEGLAAVVAAFGPKMLDSTGALDRAKMGSLVFTDAEKRKTLEQILHPRIAAAGVGAMNDLAAAGHNISVYEAALIFENGLEQAFDATLLVTTTQPLQVKRITTRDGLTEEEALQRIAAQMPLAQKEKRASHVLRNGGSLDELKRALDAIWEDISTS
tara:strand:+ start:1123 stop:1767 length:645 start_codon:yes stop_codon:yes gene_type:complete